MKALVKIALISSLLSLSACAHFAANDATDESRSDKTPQAQKYVEPDYQDFDLEKDTLYDLAVAEIAAQRQEFNVTLLNYIQQARMTRDVGIIKRAINAAQYLKDIEAIKEMALLWSEVEPDSVPAHQLLVFQYSLQQDYAQAMYHTERIIELGGEARVDSLAVGSTALPTEDKEVLLKLYGDLYQKYPDYHELGYSYALVQRNLERYDDALNTLEPILVNAPDFVAPSVLKANILYDQGKLQEAINYAGDKFDDFPKNHNLGRLYATMLIENKQLDEAEEVFFALMQAYPQASSLKLSHAIVMLENNKVSEAKAAFNELIESKQNANEAHYYLARIADAEGDIQTAIDHYIQVQPSPHFESALERSSYLMVSNERTDEMLARLAKLREERPDSALKLWMLEVKLMNSQDDKARLLTSMNAALLANPGNEDILYARAMHLESEDDLVGMERDLRSIIDNNPDHAVAINALGYTLADRTNRLQEAFQLIQKALSLKPNNPAIQDSMGWVLYRLNQKKEALVFLLKAFQQVQDGEIAAHLGEVLWSLNQVTEARDVWGNMIVRLPDHEVLMETINRLDPELLDLIKEKENTLNSQGEASEGDIAEDKSTDGERTENEKLETSEPASTETDTP